MERARLRVLHENRNAITARRIRAREKSTEELSFGKIVAARNLNDLHASSFSAERIGWLPCLRAFDTVRLADGSVSVPIRPHPGESGVATAITGLACSTAPSSARRPRSAVMGNPATTVVRLAQTLSRGDTRDGCPLASHPLSMVLGLALAGSAPSRPQSGESGGASPDLSIFRMMAENPTWGAPRIHGELLMLGFDIAERSISRWMKRAPRNPDLAKRWLVFLRNHREAIAAMDFFTVPTLTFGILYCLPGPTVRENA